MKNYGDTLSETAKRVSEKYSHGLVHIVKADDGFARLRSRTATTDS